jgi:multisubunit Na+/H+ antiporter MnhF subunit
MEIMGTELIIASAFLGLMCFILIYRVARGPHAVDRVIAADSIDILTATMMVVFGAFSGRGFYLDLAIIVALLGLISTIVISRYLEGKL